MLLLLYFKVPKFVTDALDARAMAIAKELEEATKLREEAQTLLASYQRQQRSAEREADDIIEQAKREAELMRKEAEDALAAQIERRTKLAEERIAQAEVQAMKEVKDVAADIAAQAARRLMAEAIDESSGARLIDASIEEVRDKLH